MKIAITALLLSFSCIFASHDLTLESNLSDLSFAPNEEFRSLMTEFITAGQFGTGYPYNPVVADSATLKVFTECIDRDFTSVYATYGYDTQIGVLFLGCAYRLDWFE